MIMHTFLTGSRVYHSSFFQVPRERSDGRRTHRVISLGTRKLGRFEEPRIAYSTPGSGILSIFQEHGTKELSGIFNSLVLVSLSRFQHVSTSLFLGKGAQRRQEVACGMIHPLGCVKGGDGEQTPQKKWYRTHKSSKKKEEGGRT